MTGFRFSLEKALELRRLQLELAETNFQQQAAALLELERVRQTMLASRADAEAQVRAAAQVRAGGKVQGFDLAALGAYRLHVQAQEKDLAQRRAQGERKLEELREAMLEARRRCRLLEKLRERRKADWDTALNRELEEIAAESFLAQWNRGKA